MGAPRADLSTAITSMTLDELAPGVLPGADHRGDRYDAVVDALVETVGGMIVGDPHDAGTEVGPLGARRQQARVEPGPAGRTGSETRCRNAAARRLLGGLVVWGALLTHLLKIRDKQDVASYVSLVGYRIGIIQGCIQARVIFL